MQGVPKGQGSAGKKRSAEAWTLSQSSKSPAKVAAAHKVLEGKLSKSRKSSQVRMLLSSAQIQHFQMCALPHPCEALLLTTIT